MRKQDIIAVVPTGRLTERILSLMTVEYRKALGWWRRATAKTLAAVKLRCDVRGNKYTEAFCGTLSQ